MDLAGLQETIEAIGSDGVELMPVRPPAIANTIIKPLYSELLRISPAQTLKYGHLIVALHESFLGQSHEQPDPRLKITGKQLATPSEDGFLGRVIGSAIMPPGETSLFQLATIAHRLGRESTMTCVVFPNQRGSIYKDRKQAALFPGGALIQPTPDVLAAWNIHPAKAPQPERLAEALDERNYKVAAGFFHFYRKGRVVNTRIGGDHSVEDAVTTYMERFLVDRTLGEVQIELNRNDYAKFDPDWCKVSLQETIALQMGSKTLRHLPLGRRLEQLRSANWQGNVVLELSAAGAIHALNEMGKKITRKNILLLHQNINGNLREELPFLKSSS